MSAKTLPANLKRKFPRRQLSRPVGVLLNGVYFLCRALDVSESGLSIEIPTQSELVLVPGKEVLITLKIPAGLFIVARAEALERNEPEPKNSDDFRKAALAPGLKEERGEHVALSFLDLTLYQRRLIRDFVSSKAANETVHALELD